MTKTQLVEALANAAGLEKKQTKLFLDGLTQVVEKTLKKGGDVPLTGLGKFKVLNRKARMGRNPQTGEQITIEARRVLTFKPSNVLKAALNV